MKERKNAIKERMLKAGRAHAAEQARKAYDRAKDTAENLMDDGQVTPEEYASDQVKYTSEEAADYAVRAAGHDAKAAVQKGRESVRRHAEKAKMMEGRGAAPASGARSETPVHGAASTSTPDVPYCGASSVSAPAHAEIVQRSVDVRSISHSPRFNRTQRMRATNDLGSRGRGAEAVKVPGGISANHSKQAVELSRQAAIRSTQSAMKAEAVVKKQAGQTANAAKRAAQAAKNSAKAAFASAKSGLALLTGGGSAALLMLIPVLVIALLAGSVFGIFLPDDEEQMSTRTVVQSIDQEYNERIEACKSASSYDECEITGSRAPWAEVLAVYAVKVNSDPENPRDVASMDEDRAETLRDVFWDMTTIDSGTETIIVTETVETVDEDGNPITETVEVEKTVLHITISHLTAEEMAQQYGFNEERMTQLAELLSDEYASLWNGILYGTHSGSSDLVAVALSQVGNTGETYWTYMGYTSRVEWCACFVSWCANECGYIEDGTLPKTAGCSVGVQWFKDRNRWQEPIYTNAQGQTVPYIPAPGDIIYFDWDREGEGQDGIPDHVGIIEKVEDGRVYTVEGNSSDGVRNNSWAIGWLEFFGFGIPRLT